MATRTHHRDVRDRRTRYLWASNRFAVRLLGVVVATFCSFVFGPLRQMFSLPSLPDVRYYPMQDSGPGEVMGVSFVDPLYESFVGYLVESQHFLEAAIGFGYVELLVAVFAVGIVLELFDRTDLLGAVKAW